MVLKCKECGKELKVMVDNSPYNSDVYYIGDKVVCSECFNKNKTKIIYDIQFF